MVGTGKWSFAFRDKRKKPVLREQSGTGTSPVGRLGFQIDPEAIGDDVDDIAAASGIEAIVAVEDFPRDRHARRLAALR